jgi:hypothetical protein
MLNMVYSIPFSSLEKGEGGSEEYIGIDPFSCSFYPR